MAALLVAQLASGMVKPASAADAAPLPKVIIDQDAFGPGGSDIQSILMLMQDKDVDLLGICVVTGDGWRNEEVSHALRILETAHRAAVPVHPGAVFPLLDGRRRSLAWERLYGNYFYDGAFMSHWPAESTVDWTPLHPTKSYWVPPLSKGEPSIHAPRESAVSFMLRMVHEYPHQATIIAAVLLTDLALAGKRDPKFATLAKQLVFWYPWAAASIRSRRTPPLLGRTTTPPRREFNVRWDPEAASITLRQP